MYPRLTIDTKKIAANVKQVTDLCRDHGIEVCGVTKVFGGDGRIAQVYADNGVASLGDSRLEGLAKYQDIALPKVLIRAPQVGDAEEVVRLADISVNTEIPTLAALEQACARQGKQHGVLLMCDLGDLREGFVEEAELFEAARFVAKAEHLKLAGIGANLNCLSFILPDRGKMEELVALAGRLQEECGVQVPTVSGGNSTNLHMLLTEGVPTGITQLRLGESLLFGRERATYQYLPGTFNDAFIFEAGIIELKDKPSKPWGTAGADSYGKYHRFEDRGTRKRAILAFGHQDTEAEVMWPLDAGVEIVDSASDHTVVDLTDSKREYRVGDTVALRCGYHAVARAFISPYVEKVFI